MTARDFKGIPSIQEVECWGEGLKPEVKLLSLKLYRVSDNYELGSLNILTKNCLTHSEYSSCYVNSSDTHKSRLRVLVPDLKEEENREYECKALALGPSGDGEEVVWSIMVMRPSE